MVAAIDRGRDALVPNLLSLSRIPLAALLWIAPHEPAWTLGVLSVAGLTDVLDGWLVRRGRLRRVQAHDPSARAAGAARGAFIDGMADKIFVVSTVGLLAWTLSPPWWVLAVLAIRELLFIPLMIAYRTAPPHLRERVNFTANTPGKIATLAQFTAVVAGLLQSPWFVEAALLAGFLGASATLYYIIRAFDHHPDR